MRIYDIIDKKRNSKELTRDEIAFFINGYTLGEIPDYQISALLMAICLNGMTDNETAAMTEFMSESGDMLDLSEFGDNSVDKHSTGGVGDKTTLIIAPVVASLGCTVSKLSGRGLGHTGGTLDKLESIKGCRIDFTPNEFMSIARECGVSVCGAGENIVPADKKLYALRDVTATVSSIPLIVSSIMSKKLAGGAKTIVLDVKTGSGAFMKTLDDARELAKRMVAVGKLNDRKVSAVITDMERPLGYCIGNALEVAEAVAFLRNDHRDTALYNVCKALASEMVSRSKNISLYEAENKVDTVLNNGSAYEAFKKWITLQNGDVTVFDDLKAFADAKYKSYVISEKDGYIASVDAAGIGITAMMLGAGRKSKEDNIDMSAGIIQYARVGDHVKKGERIALMQSSTVNNFTAAQKCYLDAITYSNEKPLSSPEIFEIIR